MDLIDDRVILVSGGARGMGAAQARGVVAQGGRVLIGDLLEEVGEALAKELGASAAFVHLDVTVENSWRNAVATATERFGRLDGLINNAGRNSNSIIEAVTRQEMEQVFAVNQLGVVLGIKHVVATLRQGGGGAIVNIGSNASLRPMVGKAAYGGSKSAMLRITQIAALELAADKIRVNAVLPGATRTPMSAAASPERVKEVLAMVPLGVMCEPEDIANAAIFLLSDAARMITGAELCVDGGMTIS